MLCIYVYIYISLLQASLVLCALRRVKDRRILPNHQPRLKNTCVRRVVLDRWFPLILVTCLGRVVEREGAAACQRHEWSEDEQPPLGGTSSLTLLVLYGLICCMRVSSCQGSHVLLYYVSRLENTSVTQAVLDKWFPLNCITITMCITISHFY